MEWCSDDVIPCIFVVALKHALTCITCQGHVSTGNIDLDNL